MHSKKALLIPDDEDVPNSINRPMKRMTTPTTMTTWHISFVSLESVLKNERATDGPSKANSQ